jgi:hypothetical protein
MLVFIFIAGLVSGASLGIVLLSLLIAGKRNDAIYYTCPQCKITYTVRDVEVGTIIKETVQH